MRILIFTITVAILILCSLHLISAKHATSEKISATPFADTLTKEIAEIGRRVFISTCSACHKDSAKSGAPAPEILASMTPRSVLASLTIGKMRAQAEKLSDKQRRAVAQWITKKVLKENNIPKEAYTAFDMSGSKNSIFNHSGWGGNAEGTGFRTAEQAGIDTTNVASLTLKWAFAFPDASQVRSKPAVINGWLVTGSQFGDVYALEMKSGKIGWHFAADAAVRGAVSVTDDGKNITAYFADYSTNVYAVDVRTGKLKWKTRAGYHPQSSNTGTVAVFDKVVYVPITSFEVISSLNPDYDCCSSSGGVVALDAQTGNIIWQYKVIAEEAKVTTNKRNGKSFYGPSGAPVWCSPT
ncbi:MAG: dehydrogenase, partial [Segetibacter sp.]|nr:dehydrogenase [Segetibacter sp.]